MLQTDRIFQIKRRGDVVILLIQQALFLPDVGVGAIRWRSMHAEGHDIIVFDLPIDGARLFDEAKRIPNLHDIAKVAVAIIPRRFEPGLFIGRVENGEGHTGHIAAEFAVSAKLHVFGVVLGGCDIGVAHRQVGCFPDFKREFAGFDPVEDFDRQIILGCLPRIWSDLRSGSQPLH